MPLGILFWFLMILCAIFNVWGYRAPEQRWVLGGGYFLTFILFAIVGWQVFGPVVK